MHCSKPIKKSTPLITVDVDGVLAGGGYIPAWDRKPEIYESLSLLDPACPSIINELTRTYNVYVVSSRKFPNALDVTRRWLNEHGFYLSWLAGVVCAAGAPAKSAVIDLLRPRVHIDDSPELLRGLQCSKLLFLGNTKKYWWPDARAGATTDMDAVCYDWGEVPEVLETLCARPSLEQA